jgi:hypothetical protein
LCLEERRRKEPRERNEADFKEVSLVDSTFCSCLFDSSAPEVTVSSPGWDDNFGKFDEEVCED